MGETISTLMTRTSGAGDISDIAYTGCVQTPCTAPFSECSPETPSESCAEGSAGGGAALSDVTVFGGRCSAERVVAGRVRRAVAGAVLIVGAGILVLRSLVADAASPGVLPASWEIVLATWIAALASAVCAGPIARLHPWASPRLSQDDGLLVASLVLPAAGLAACVPVTMHMPIVLAVSGSEMFDVWCTRSVGLVAHAHVLLAVLVAHRASSVVARAERAHRTPSVGLRHPCAPCEVTKDDDAATSAAIYVLTILVSAVPFGLSHVMPPLLFALTGLPVLAVAYPASAIVTREAKTLHAHLHAHVVV